MSKIVRAMSRCSKMSPQFRTTEASPRPKPNISEPKSELLAQIAKRRLKQTNSSQVPREAEAYRELKEQNHSASISDLELGRGPTLYSEML